MPAKRLPPKNTNQGRHKTTERGDDLYPTDPPPIRALLAAESIPTDAPIWEPAAGLGHMSRELARAGLDIISTDLVDYGAADVQGNIDFLKTTAAPSGVRTLITNPPFGIATQFVRHALTLVERVYILNRLMFLEGVGRSDLIDRKLVRVYPFKERLKMMHRWSRGLYKVCSSCSGDGCDGCESGVIFIKDDGVWREWQGKKSTQMMPFAWFVFDRSHDAHTSGTALKRLSWRPFA